MTARDHWMRKHQDVTGIGDKGSQAHAKLVVAPPKDIGSGRNDLDGIGWYR